MLATLAGAGFYFGMHLLNNIFLYSSEQFV